MKTKWTPGPWTVTRSPRGHVKWIRGGAIAANAVEPPAIARIVHAHGFEMEAANARLISLAPEMAEALRAILAKLDNMTSEQFSRGEDKPEREQARSLLARLEGGEK